MDKYLVIIEGDCNDADYAYCHEIVDKEGLDHIKDLWHSVTLILERYRELHPDCRLSWRVNLPYYDTVLDSLGDYRWFQGEPVPEGFEGWEHLLEDFIDFDESYVPHGTSDCDYVHTITSIEAYRLADETPIDLMK